MRSHTGVHAPATPGPGAAVAPLPTPPPVRTDWTAWGLPDSGLVLAQDQRLCAACTESPRPCTQSCITAHALPTPLAEEAPQCLHCTDAPCISACPVAALRHDPQGAVVLDQELCIGCRFCEDACLEGALVYLDPAEVATPAFPLPNYTPSLPTGLLPRTEAKCTLCTDRVQARQLPVCVEGCPHGALYVGNLDRNTVTNGRQVERLSRLLAQRRWTRRGSRAEQGSRILDLR